MDNHSQFIDALGGTGVVASLTGQLPNRVSNWRQRGIPWQWRYRLAQAAEDKGVPLPHGFLSPEERAAS